mmetsp:Transcript_9806/g.19682  ORF Transcript_9806/g.19682 Transcript_9806/m.19682 type:complete len:299 (+) Transcript_9806:1-897(+)
MKLMFLGTSLFMSPTQSILPSFRSFRHSQTKSRLSSFAVVTASDDEMERGRKLRDSARQARLADASSTLQSVASIDERAEVMYNETYWMKSNYQAIQRLGADVSAHRVVDVLSTEFRERIDSSTISQVVNWAYRGNPLLSKRVWTNEQHLMSGQRTTEVEVEALVNRCQRLGPEQETLLVALRQRPLSGEWSFVGTIHVQRSGANEAELGMFSVDPEVQGEGIGASLLKAAEEVAQQRAGALRTSMWVISARDELLSWYRRKGYRDAGARQRVPDEAGQFFGQPMLPLEFIQLHKTLD